MTLVDSEGAPFTGDIVDGTELWLSSDSEGAGSITATASATATAGRVFLADGQQSLILAAPVTVNATAEAVVSVHTGAAADHCAADDGAADHGSRDHDHRADHAEHVRGHASDHGAGHAQRAVACRSPAPSR